MDFYDVLFLVLSGMGAFIGGFLGILFFGRRIK